MDANEFEKRNQSLELLNATHEFPCDFTIKVIGQSDDDFVARVVETVQDAATTEERIPYQTKVTPNGKHVSVTMEPHLVSAEEVLFVYDQVKSVRGVVMTL